MGLRLLSEAVPRVTGKLFSRKYTMLGRIVTNWNDIVGEKLALKTQPVALRYMKHEKAGGKGKATASLDIAASTADATLLHYQKDLILERINAIFGDHWITAVRFVPIADNDALKKPAPKTMGKLRPQTPISMEDRASLSNLLESVGDPAIKERLEKLGKSILQNKKKN